MAVAAARPEPEREPNIALPAMLVSARDPGTLPRISIARSMILFAMPPLDISWPARMKNGTARSENESMPVTSFWAEMNMPNCGVRNMMIVTSALRMMENETGTLFKSVIRNTTTRTRAAACKVVMNSEWP